MTVSMHQHPYDTIPPIERIRLLFWRSGLFIGHLIKKLGIYISIETGPHKAYISWLYLKTIEVYSSAIGHGKISMVCIYI